jgi:hypothetical protein
MAYDFRSNAAQSASQLIEAPRALLLAPRHIHAHRNLILDRNCEERRALNLEVRASERNGSSDSDFTAPLCAFKRDLRVMSRLTRKLNFEVGVNPL